MLRGHGFRGTAVPPVLAALRPACLELRHRLFPRGRPRAPRCASYNSCCTQRLRGASAASLLSSVIAQISSCPCRTCRFGTCRHRNHAWAENRSWYYSFALQKWSIGWSDDPHRRRGTALPRLFRSGAPASQTWPRNHRKRIRKSACL
jgi:hypothetical protein